MDTYACPECRMKVVLACAGEEGGALPKFFGRERYGDGKENVRGAAKDEIENGEKDKSEKKTGMKKVGKRMIYQRPFLRTSRSAGRGRKGLRRTWH